MSNLTTPKPILPRLDMSLIQTMQQPAQPQPAQLRSKEQQKDRQQQQQPQAEEPPTQDLEQDSRDSQADQIQQQQQQPQHTSALPTETPNPEQKRPIPEVLVEERLLRAVAEVLKISHDSIDLIDSFTDLGGNEEAAVALRKRCLDTGLSLRINDILQCHTLAQLQTRIKPFEPLEALEKDPDEPASPAASQVFSEAGSRYSTDEAAEESRPKPPPITNMSDKEILEDSITRIPQVSGAAVTKPKAGLLEDKVVIFISLSDPRLSQHSDDSINVIPQSQMQYAATQVASIRLALENSPEKMNMMPDNWIVIDQLPYNSEGKLNRRALQTWVQNMNEEIYQQVMKLQTDELFQDPVTDMERTIQRAVCRVLSASERQIGMNFSFAQLGGDEMSAMHLVAACRTQGVLIQPDDIWESITLSQLATNASYKGDLANLWNEESGETFELAPMQRLYFDSATGGSSELRAGNVAGSYRFNESVLLKIKIEATIEDVHAAVEAMVAHHSMLRSRFRHTPEGWTQRVLPEVKGSYGFGYQTVPTQEEVIDVIELAQTRIDIENGPVFAVEHFRTSDEQQMIFMIAHHLVIDRASWKIIIHDFDELLREGTLCSERSMPFRTWNELQAQEMAQCSDPSPLPFPLLGCDADYWGLEESLNQYREADEISFTISAELTDILHSTCTRVFRTEPTDIYLAALYLSFAQTFSDRPAPTIWSQEHARQPWSTDIDITETVGRLSSLCPIGIRTAQPDDILHVLRDLKDTTRLIPRHGWDYFASRYFGPFADARREEGWPFEILFSYLGSRRQLENQDGALELIDIPEKMLNAYCSDSGPDVRRMALFEVNVSLERGCAQVSIVFNGESKHQERIADWIQTYEHMLYEAIGRLRYRAQELTLSDVPLLDVTYAGLTKLNTDRLLALGLTSAEDIEDVFPVTASQQEVLISQTQDLESCHSTSIYELSVVNGGQANQSQICAAWEYVVSKYPALRTVFIDSVTEDGLFDQVVLRRCSPNMFFFDAAPGQSPIESIKSLPAMSTTPSQPRHRLSICNSPTGSYIKLEASQAICDTPSIQLLMADLKRTYNSGKPPMKALDPPHLECVRYLMSARRNDSLEYWRNRLHETQPCQFPRLQSARENQMQESHYNVDIYATQIDDFCRAYGVTRGTVMRLGWGLVLRAFTGTSRVCFGYRAPGRDGQNAPKGIQQSVGCFENFIPCSMNLWAYQSIEAVLRDTDEAYSASLAHQHFAPSEIEHSVGLKDEKLFNTCMAYLEDPPVLKSRFSTNMPQLELSCQQSFCTSDYDVTFSAMFVGGQLACGISHRILSDAQAWNVAAAFGQAVTSILSSPTASVGGLDLASESNSFLTGGHNFNFPEACIHGLFINQARTAPDAPAVCAGDGELSYRTVAHLVQRLACYLSQWGVRPGVAVPVVLGKTRWSVVAILAVLKAGGCFVPVDGEDKLMVEAVLAQVNARVVLMTEHVAPDLNLMTDGVIMVNEALFATYLPTETPIRRVSGDDVALVLFPAGSSRARELRGFMYSHSAISSGFMAQGGPLNLNQGSRVLQLSSFSVDTSIVEILGTLAHGGCVCMPSANERRRDIDGAIRRMHVNWSYMTPILARTLKPAALPSLKTICFRTRGLDEDTCAPWLRHASVILAFGCLEICPLGISAIQITKGEDVQRMGQPFLGQFWIANPDDQSKLVPSGAIGQLCIAGPTIAKRFIPGQPLKPITPPTEKKTGDGRQMVRYIKTSQFVRHMEDGMMEFLPNPYQDMTIDNKVIHTAKVEQHLRRCIGQGLDVAVEVVTCSDGKQVLAAFVQLDKLWHGTEDPARLSSITRERAYLAKKFVDTSLRSSFPSHMIPTVFVPVRRLPITMAMKVNRRKLQLLVQHLSSQQLDAIAATAPTDGAQAARFKPLPLTKVESRMRSIWAAVLGAEEADIDGNQTFANLGGGNVLAARLVVECRKQGLAISIQDVLSGASLTELCQGITLSTEIPVDQNMTSGEPMVVGKPTSSKRKSGTLIDEKLLREVLCRKMDIERKDVKDVSEATSGQVRSIELGMLKERGDVDYLTFNLNGIENSKKFEAACLGISMIHPILRTAFVTHEQKLYQVALRSWCPEFKRIQCPSWRLSALAEKLIKKDQSETLDMMIPVTKYLYLDSGKQSILIMRVSKAQYDDASVPLLIRDLRKIYSSPHGPPRRPTYFDFVRSAQMAQENGAFEHWRQLLAHAKMTKIVESKTLPLLSTKVKTISQQVPMTSLNNMGLTFASVIKSAWAIVLANLSGSGDVLFGEIVRGRQVQLSDGGSAGNVLGPVAHTVPVRVRFGDAHCSPMDLLHAVEEQKNNRVQFEGSDWRDIAEKCMKSTQGRIFSTAVAHQGPETDRQSQAKSFMLGAASCKFSIQESSAKDVYDLLVTDAQLDDDTAEISLTLCEDRIPSAFAQEALKSLCSTIELLTSVSMMHPLIPSATEFSAKQPRIPLTQPELSITLPKAGQTLSSDNHFAIQSAIASAWTQILNPQALGVPESKLHETPFHDLWASLIPASQLARHLKQQLPQLGIQGLDDIKLTAEDIVAHPTMLDQVELIARKLKQRDSTRKRVSLAVNPRNTGSFGRGLRRLTDNVRGHSRGSSSEDKPTATSGLNIAHLHLEATPSYEDLCQADKPKISSSTSTEPEAINKEIQQLPDAEILEMENNEIDPEDSQPFLPLQVPEPRANSAHSSESGVGLIVDTYEGPSRGTGSSMESLTNGSSNSESEEHDLVMPLGKQLGATAQHSAAKAPSEGTDLVSPLSPPMPGKQWTEITSHVAGMSIRHFPSQSTLNVSDGEGTQSKSLKVTGKTPPRRVVSSVVSPLSVATNNPNPSNNWI